MTPAAARRVIGVVIPAHDEERLIARCLESVRRAARALDDADVRVVVACDACTDGTERIVRAAGHSAVVCDARNVGVARALGAEAALALGATWLAFTDADTIVDDAWLVAQLALDCDVVCGTIGIDDWSPYDDAVRHQFDANYRDRDGHRHIHGANLGMSAPAYRSVGGFRALSNSEDVAIVEALEVRGARIAWSARPRVFTSARPDFRATAGFGAGLAAVASSLMRATQSPSLHPT